MRLMPFLLPVALSACAGAIGPGALQNLQNPGQISGTAAGLFGIPAATVAEQLSAELSQIQMVAAQLQMLKAQLDGNLPVIPVPPPVVIPTPMPSIPTDPTKNGLVAPRRRVAESLWGKLAEAPHE